MKNTLLSLLVFQLLQGAVVCAETLSDKLSTEDLDAVTPSVTLKPQETTPEQQRIQKLTDTPEKPLDGVTIKMMDLNVSKKSSITIEYAPELKQGDLIDNKEQTNINYNLKF